MTKPEMNYRDQLNLKCCPHCIYFSTDFDEYKCKWRDYSEDGPTNIGICDWYESKEKEDG